jgi:hypothetical protein
VAVRMNGIRILPTITERPIRGRQDARSITHGGTTMTSQYRHGAGGESSSDERFVPSW